jgi:hypothetical protein
MRNDKSNEGYKLAVSELIARHLHRCQQENPYVTNFKA